MPLPTLMVRGKLVPPNGDPELKKYLDEWIPYEYIINWFKIRSGKTGIENRVCVLKSETSSGKSTMFPPELYKALVRGVERSPGIICTQPRVMTAIENVNEMMKHYSSIFRLGENIGWSTKNNKLRPRSFGLLSATIGTLAQQLRTMTDEEIMRKYRFILIDETHERDLQTDMTIYMLKNLLVRNASNPQCPFVVLMSATFDPQSFIDYFGVRLEDNFIWCRGETAGFDEIWDWNEGRTVNNYPQAAATVVERILKENPNDDPATADILIFMPGRAEFMETNKHLEGLNKRLASAGASPFSLLNIDGVAVQTQNRDYKWTMYVPVSEQEVVIGGKKYTPGRRVIISTNVAETGLTLDNLKYVIDGGFNREIEYNPVYGVRGLITKPAPKSRIKQRRGRAGRKFRGVFYPLYPQYIYDRLPELQLPQILIEDVSVIFLDMINEQLKAKTLSGVREPEFNAADIDMVDPPAPDSLHACMEKLYALGFISPLAPPWNPDREALMDSESSPDSRDHRFSITKLGAVAGIFSGISPENIRMILAAYSWGASVLDMITIAAYLSMDARGFARSIPDADARAPKPKINWSGVYKTGLPGYINDGALYKVRLLIADDFINGLILFNAAKYIISSSAPKQAINSLHTWCDQNNVSSRSIIDFIRTRDDIIEQMLTERMEIFANEDNSLANTADSDFMNTITRIKYCIYDGYRGNLLTRVGEKYYTISTLEVTKPKLFRDDEAAQAAKTEYGFVLESVPQLVLYRELSLKYNRKTYVYEVLAEQISTMDGFVSPDVDFTL